MIVVSVRVITFICRLLPGGLSLGVDPSIYLTIIFFKIFKIWFIYIYNLLSKLNNYTHILIDYQIFITNIKNNKMLAGYDSDN